jgi:hypothetical protein
MNLEPHMTPATVRAIYEHYKTKRQGGHRPHLGGSQIGRECARAIWYQFRHAATPEFEGRMLRLFETGDREEDRLVENLRAVGVTVWARDPDTGKQFRYEAHGGHFALSLDGVGQGFAESGKPHLLEFKTMNDKAFKDIQAKGLQASKPVYWAQVQVGMHLAGLDRAYFFAVCKSSDEIYAERVRYDAAEGMKLIAKAGQIIFSDTPPSRLSDDPSFYMCKFCEFAPVCHQWAVPEVNCRTCAHVSPEQDGTWSCAAGGDLTPCPAHIFNPHMLTGWTITDAGDDWIEYTTPDGEIIRNAGNSVDMWKERGR